MINHLCIFCIILSIVSYTASCSKHVNTNIIESFGIITYNGGESSETIYLQLWYSNTTYQCSILPNIPETNFGCDNTTWTASYSPNNCTSNPKMMIENDNSDSVWADRVYINLRNGTFYGIDGICIYPPYTNFVGDKYGEFLGNSDSLSHCGANTIYSWIVGVDYQDNDWGPPQQIIEFDTTRPNQYINNAVWRHELPCLHEPLYVSSSSVHSFGIIVSDDSKDATDNIVNLQLLFSDLTYQCSVMPDTAGTDYWCDSATWTVTYSDNHCITDPKIMIENSDSDALVIRDVYMNLNDSSFYGITGICIYPPYTDISGDFYYQDGDYATETCGENAIYSQSIGVDNDATQYAPSKQLLSFDITSPNEYINNAVWESVDSLNCSLPPTSSPSNSPTNFPINSASNCVDFDPTYNSLDGTDITMIIDASKIPYPSSNSTVDEYIVSQDNLFVEGILCNHTRANICFIGCYYPGSCLETVVNPLGGMNILTINCNITSSCTNMKINITHSTISQFSMICVNKFACNGAEIFIESTQGVNISLDCQSASACSNMIITLENNMKANISCYHDNACDNLMIDTDHSKDVHIHLNMYRYSEDITIHEYYWQNVETTCGYHQDKRYIQYPTNYLLDSEDILKLARDEYPSSNKLPCEDIMIECTGNQTDFERKCEYQYQLSDQVELDSILTSESRPKCYWLDIGQLYTASCKGTCGDTIRYHRFNQTFSLYLVFEYENDTSTLRRMLENNALTTRSYRVCDAYFGDVNVTERTLTSIDAIFDAALAFVSASGQTIHDVIVPPETSLGENMPYIICTNGKKNAISITTSLTVESASSDQNEVQGVFDANGDFITKSQELLSKLFGVPVIIEVNIDQTVTNEGFTSGEIAGIVIGAIVVTAILVTAIGWIIRYCDRKRKTIFVRNPMVISIGIGYYDNEVSMRDREYKVHATDLDDGIKRDIDNSIKLFKDVFKYDIFPKQYDGQDLNSYKAYWSKGELIKFLIERSSDLDQSSYDGLIALISGHGIGGKDMAEKILTSDYGLITKTDLHRIFSNSGKSRDIPRMFVFDCFSGTKDRETEPRHRLTIDEDENADESDESENENAKGIKRKQM